LEPPETQPVVGLGKRGREEEEKEEGPYIKASREDIIQAMAWQKDLSFHFMSCHIMSVILPVTSVCTVCLY
jgi:hypothetical protein